MNEHGVLDVEVSEAEWREWLKQYEWHLDQVPLLIETMREQVVPLAAATYGDVVQSNGSKARLPMNDTASDDSVALWTALYAYTRAVQRRLGECVWPAVVPLSQMRQGDERAEAFRVTGWLVERVERIVDHHDLAEGEGRLFQLIRRGRARYQTGQAVQRAKARCTSCGALRVTVEWVDGANGSPKPVQVALCGFCGATYREPAGGAS